MTKSNSSKLFAEDPEIEQIALQNLKVRIRQRAEELGVELENVQSKNMVEPQKTVSEYAKPSLVRVKSSIVRPTIVANNFKIKANIIQIVQQFV